MKAVICQVISAAGYMINVFNLEKSDLDELDMIELQSERPKQYSEEDSGWLKCNTETRKSLPIFALQQQIIETTTCLGAKS